MNLEIVTLWEKEAFKRAITIEPSKLKRNWMDDTHIEYAYRCLPLNIANQHGWAIYLNDDVSAVWNGTRDHTKESIRIYNNRSKLAISHFGYGVLTFSLPFLVRLDPGYNLYITGAPNHFIKGIQPCTGIFEADWAPYSFTMNWRFTHPDELVTFTTKDPICFFFPVPKKLVENSVTKISTLEDQEQEYRDQYNKFHNDREKFGESIHTKELDQSWQKHYFRGLYPDGLKCPANHHQTKIRPNKFE